MMKRFSLLLFLTLAFGVTIFNSAFAASASTQGCLGIPGFGCIGDGEFSGTDPLTKGKYEHDGTLVSADGIYTADVDGYVDLGPGQLASNGMVTSPLSAPEINGLDGGVIYGNSSFSDIIYFSNTGSGDYDVTINMLVTGSLDTAGSDVYAESSFVFGTGADDGDYTSDGPVNDLLTATITLNGESSVILSAYIGYSVDSYAGFGAETDIDLLANFELLMPEGVSFTTQSEQFLASPVPVPAALPLLAFAMGALGVVSRRKL